jgi:hypothetical protein
MPWVLLNQKSISGTGIILGMTRDKYIESKHFSLNVCFELSLMGSIIFFIVNIEVGFMVSNTAMPHFFFFMTTSCFL